MWNYSACITPITCISEALCLLKKKTNPIKKPSAEKLAPTMFYFKWFEIKTHVSPQVKCHKMYGFKWKQIKRMSPQVECHKMFGFKWKQIKRVSPPPSNGIFCMQNQKGADAFIYCFIFITILVYWYVDIWHCECCSLGHHFFVNDCI